ncbi:MAG: peptidylprolyl isomerase [Limnohabitans sp.]|nr:peptidylprolyl isomerase [Limnohabitans sp.]
MKKIFTFVFAFLLLSTTFAQGVNTPKVKLNTSAGEIIIELYADKAPKTVANFLQYVEDKHYDGTIFHRVIDNFMIQAGGYDQRYAEKKTRAPIAHEGREALSKGGPRNTVGTIAMARTNEPHSASAQFFINVKDNTFLDPSASKFGYTVFGRAISGMDVVNRIKGLPTANGGPFPSDMPLQQVVIQSATLVQ